MFGGERVEDSRILNTLAVFDTNSSEWSYPNLLNSSQSVSPIAVTGHTATLVEDKMIVIFGLTKTGLFPGIQEYDIGKTVGKRLPMIFQLIGNMKSKTLCHL